VTRTISFSKRTSAFVMITLALLFTLFSGTPKADADWWGVGTGHWSTGWPYNGALYTGAGGSITNQCFFQGNTTTMYDSATFGGVNCADQQVFFQNHGTSCSGCQDTRIYWTGYYYGSSACLPKGLSWSETSNGPQSWETWATAVTFTTAAAGQYSSVWWNTGSMAWGTC
jgi:hypothetical protein